LPALTADRVLPVRRNRAPGAGVGRRFAV